MKSAYHYARRKAFKDKAPDPMDLRLCPQHKIAYKSIRVAKQTAALAFKESSKVLSAYKCPFCHHWHLTSQVKS